jgi:galactose mutarotase-like enzyme
MKDGETRSGYFSTSSGDVRTLILVANRISSGGYPPYGTPVRIESSRHGGVVHWDLARDEPVYFVMNS